MAFIITLVSLIIERFFHWGPLRHWRWFNVYQRKLSHSRLSKLPSYLLLILSILPLVLIVGLINYFLDGWIHGILKIIFGILVLWYCLGPANLWVQIYRCITQLNKQEEHTAAIECIQTEFGIHSAENAQAFHQAFTRAIFTAANERIFSVVFWFVLLGPVGAVLYRSIALMHSDSSLGLSRESQKIQALLDWIPVRIFTFIFALGGHFAEVFARWKKTVLKGPETNQVMLSDCGIAALDVMTDVTIPEDGSAEQKAIDLLDRVFVISLAVLAMIVLIL